MGTSVFDMKFSEHSTTTLAAPSFYNCILSEINLFLPYSLRHYSLRYIQPFVPFYHRHMFCYMDSIHHWSTCTQKADKTKVFLLKIIQIKITNILLLKLLWWTHMCVTLHHSWFWSSTPTTQRFIYITSSNSISTTRSGHFVTYFKRKLILMFILHKYNFINSASTQ